MFNVLQIHLVWVDWLNNVCAHQQFIQILDITIKMVQIAFHVLWELHPKGECRMFVNVLVHLYFMKGHVYVHLTLNLKTCNVKNAI